MVVAAGCKKGGGGTDNPQTKEDVQAKMKAGGEKVPSYAKPKKGG
jgi:hypothetical protein